MIEVPGKHFLFATLDEVLGCVWDGEEGELPVPGFVLVIINMKARNHLGGGGLDLHVEARACDLCRIPEAGERVLCQREPGDPLRVLQS